MAANGDMEGSEGSAAEPREPLWSRLRSACAGGAAAVGAGAAAAASAAGDGLEGLKSGTHRTAVKMDKWAADGVVRGAVGVGGQRGGLPHPPPPHSGCTAAVGLHLLAAAAVCPAAACRLSSVQPYEGLAVSYGALVTLLCMSCCRFLSRPAAGTPPAPPALLLLLPPAVLIPQHWFALCRPQVGRAFCFKDRGAKLTTELRAGFITFLMVGGGGGGGAVALGGGRRSPSSSTKHACRDDAQWPCRDSCCCSCNTRATQVAYILAVNPQVLATTGGTCDPAEVCEVRAASRCVMPWHAVCGSCPCCCSARCVCWAERGVHRTGFAGAWGFPVLCCVQPLEMRRPEELSLSTSLLPAALPHAAR